MDEFLRKLRLKDNFAIELEVEKYFFVDRLTSVVDPGNTGILFSAFEGLSSSKKEYKGKVSDHGFEIRRRKRLFDMNMGSAIAKGQWRQKDDQLIIETEINSFNNFFIFFYSLYYQPTFCVIALFSDNSSIGIGNSVFLEVTFLGPKAVYF